MPSKYRTGFCSNGQHEGTKPHSPSGRALKVCVSLEVCKCQCHLDITKMFEMMEMPRQIIDNPEYVPFKRTYWMPSDDPSYYDRPSLVDEEDTEDPGYSVRAGVPVPHLRPRSYTPTPSGRAARGQLEYNVKQVCDGFMAGEYEVEFCTPKFIANTIDPADPPSVGAIDAVFKRWTALGFAVIHNRPTRFHAYTPDGMVLGLDALKARVKRADKQAASAARRGVRF